MMSNDVRVQVMISQKSFVDLTNRAFRKGLSNSAYVRMLIIENLNEGEEKIEITRKINPDPILFDKDVRP